MGSLRLPFLSWFIAVSATKMRVSFLVATVLRANAYIPADCCPVLLLPSCFTVCFTLQLYWVCFWMAEKCCLPFLTHVQTLSRCLLPCVKSYLEWKLGYVALEKGEACWVWDAYSWQVKSRCTFRTKTDALFMQTEPEAMSPPLLSFRSYLGFRLKALLMSPFPSALLSIACWGWAWNTGLWMQGLMQSVCDSSGKTV